MKKIAVLLVVAIAMIACNNKKETVEAKDSNSEMHTDQKMEGDAVMVNTTDSYVWYKGSKKIGGAHEGKVMMKEGKFMVKDEMLTGGKFVIDMTSISNDDLKNEEENAKLVGHLKNEDFFNVEKFPTAKFKILEVKHLEKGGKHELVGSMTIMETTKNITVPATVVVDGDNVSIEADFNIDRTDFGIVYGSGTKFTDLAKDKIINDVIELKVVAKS